MQSTWSSSASASATRATSAARLAKSAARIDGASFTCAAGPYRASVRARGRTCRRCARADGQQERAPPVRAATASPGGSSATKSGSSDAANASTAMVSILREGAHRVDEPAAGLHRVAPRPTSSARWSAARSRHVARPHAPARVGPAAQHAEAACTARRAAPGRRRRRRTAGWRPSATSGRDRRRAPPRARAARISCGRARGARRPRSRARRRACARRRPVALPPGAEATSRMRSPGCGSSARHDAWLAWSWGVTRPSRDRVERAEVAGVAHNSASGTRVPGSTSTPRARSSAVTAACDRRAQRVHAQRDRRAARCRASSVASRVGASERVDEAAARSSRGATCACRRPTHTSSPAASGARRARRARANAARRWRSRGARVERRRPSPPPRRAATRRRGAGTHRAAAPARTSGSSESSGRDSRRRSGGRRARAHAHRAVDELGDEGAVARRRVRAAQQLGQEDVRERAVFDAQQRVERDPARRGRVVARRSGRVEPRRAAEPRSPRGGAPSPACPRVGPRRARAALTRWRPRRRWRPTPASIRRRAVRPAASCARQTFTRRPADWNHAPGRRVARADEPASSVAGRGGVETELLDGELVGVGRLADLRLRCGVRDAGRCSTNNSVPAVDEPLVQLARASRRRDRDRAPGRRPGRCRGRPRSA